MNKGNSIIQTLVKVMGELGPVAKDKTNAHFRYEYRSHAGLMKKLQPLLVKHGLLMYPSNVEVVLAEREHVIEKTTFVISDGENSVEVVGLGEGFDKGDKASYKAQTGAHKYALNGLFSIPDEADAEGDKQTDIDDNPVGTEKYNPTKEEKMQNIVGHLVNGSLPSDIIADFKKDFALTAKKVGGLKGELMARKSKELDEMLNWVTQAVVDLRGENDV